MEEGVLATWHKKEGDSVEVDDLLAEVETDKATMEFRAFDKGTLLKILVGPGTQVKLGQAVAIVGAPGEDVSALVATAGGVAAPPAPPAPAVAPTAQTPQVTSPTQTLAPPRASAPEPRPKAPRGSVLTRTERDAEVEHGAAADGVNGRVLASPYVRRVARERGIDLQGALGSGEHGRILPGDLESLARAGTMPPATPAVAGAPAAPLARQVSVALAAPTLAQPEVRPLSPMRKTIARRLVASKQTVPHFYLTIDVDAGALTQFRERLNGELAPPPGSGDGEAQKPLKLSVNDLLVKAVAAALVRVPECNAQFTDEAILVHQRVDVSVAVAIPDGLVTPVVRDADKKSIVAIAREIRDLAARARAKKLRPEEMSDGTFSISNLGMFGIDEFSAVINPPEGAILAVGQVRDEPVVKDGAVVAGERLAMTLSCDHRVIDGAVGASFLAELRALLEHPMRILTG
jgi:pyruvate dehydrogenase E2 component (dihydrolipoamide acetyltransferase)